MSASNRKRQAAEIQSSRGSAGRANGGRTGKREPSLRAGGSMADFARHCDRFMVEHVPGYRCRDFIGRDVTAAIRNMAW